MMKKSRWDATVHDVNQEASASDTAQAGDSFISHQERPSELSPNEEILRSTVVWRAEAVWPSASKQIGPIFWYSRGQIFFFAAALFLLTEVFSSLTPPFQSPDEFAHVSRAYLLSGGHVLATAHAGVTGGQVDAGLLNYMNCFTNVPSNYNVKVTRSAIRACNGFHYTGRTRFSGFANTAVYFPLLYAPQACALFLGAYFHLTVETSYYLARLFSLCVVLAVLTCASITFPIPPSVLALFLMPMCLFQLSSASLDAVSFSITVFVATLFLRGANRVLRFDTRTHLVLAVCLLLLSTARIVYVTLTPLLLILYRIRRDRAMILSFALVLGSSLIWILYVGNTTLSENLIVQDAGIGPSDIVRYYLTHPVSLFGVAFRTLTSGETLRFYWQTFTGVLGWADTPLGSVTYLVLGLEFFIVTVISSRPPTARMFSVGDGALICGAVSSLMLLFAIALVAWTPHPAKVVEGIEGRYLYPAVILLMFSSGHRQLSKRISAVSSAILVLIALSSVIYSVPRLLDRYWTNEVACSQRCYRAPP